MVRIVEDQQVGALEVGRYLLHFVHVDDDGAPCSKEGRVGQPGLEVVQLIVGPHHLVLSPDLDQSVLDRNQEDLVQWYEDKPVSAAANQLVKRPSGRGGGALNAILLLESQGIAEHELASSIQRLAEPLAAYGFEQIARCIYLESSQSIVVECGGKND